MKLGACKIQTIFRVHEILLRKPGMRKSSSLCCGCIENQENRNVKIEWIAGEGMCTIIYWARGYGTCLPDN